MICVKSHTLYTSFVLIPEPQFLYILGSRQRSSGNCAERTSNGLETSKVKSTFPQQFLFIRSCQTIFKLGLAKRNPAYHENLDKEMFPEMEGVYATSNLCLALPIIHEYIWSPQKSFRYPHTCHTAIFSLIPRQVIIVPVLVNK